LLSSNLDLAPDGKRFAVLALPETAPGEKHSVHVTRLLNFFDELRRRVTRNEPAARIATPSRCGVSDVLPPI
jgi:hypothetical protein